MSVLARPVLLPRHSIWRLQAAYLYRGRSEAIRIPARRLYTAAVFCGILFGVIARLPAPLTVLFMALPGGIWVISKPTLRHWPCFGSIAWRD